MSATAQRNNLLEEYLLWGGFPEVVLADRTDLKRNLLTSYVDTMILRDVLDRHQVKNLVLLERLFQKVLLSFTKEFSVHRWYNDFRSQGFKLSKDTLYDYLSFLEESLFIQIVENAVNLGAAKKIFLVDNGIYQQIKDRPDTGKLWENACFLQLVRQGKKPRFWRDDRGEVDFVTDEALIQVTTELSEENQERELGPLKLLSEQFPAKEARVLTWPQGLEEA